MSSPNGNKPRNEVFLDALVAELASMSDTDALEGENAEELSRLGERLLKGAREEAGKLRLADAKRKLAAIPKSQDSIDCPSVEEARQYLQSHPNLTLAARGLNELSDEDVLDLFRQTRCLEQASDDGTEDSSE